MPFPTPCNLGLSRFPPDAPPIAPAGSMELANVQPVSATPVEDPQVNQGGLPAGPPAEQPVGPGSVRSSISVLTLYMILTLGLISSDLALLQMNLIVLSTTKVPMTTTASSWDPGTFHKNYIVPFHQFKVGEDILHQHASMFPGPQFGQCCGTSEPNSLCGVWIVTICSLVHQAFMSSASSVPLHSIIHFILEYATCHGCFLDKMVPQAVQQEDQLADHPGSLVGLPLEWLTQAEHWPVPCCQLGQWVGHQEGICSKCWPGIEGWWAGMCLVLV
ncbi:hypothetical protein EDD17DRAFT_1510694 [Pisolithus thermaeus]|nr:hypothetical protein EV401DRAFT_1890272 [Pisolithus croceorrhizus]KAI6160164.1 hypothetical protein EDD17DRAFT_1510694 [Pisolithus thermaeus]